MSSLAGPDLAEYALRLGDDALIAAQRLAEWSAHAPEMEEDVALTNIALDQLGVARYLLSYAAEFLGGDEDSLAFLREDRQFRNCLLVELPRGDFGVTMAKLLFLAAYQTLLYQRLASSTDGRLAEVAARASNESAYHLDHARQWTLRLGDGTPESHGRMQAAVDDVWPYTHELFDDDELTAALQAADAAPAPSSLKPQWIAIIDDVLGLATLARPADGWHPTGGRVGRHTEHLSYLLAEMQVLHRAHPGARW